MLPLVATLLAATALRIYLIARDSVPFAYDMGRDLLWAKDIVFYQTPTLIGPAASIWGVYFGPLWFYFLSVPLFISGGNPISTVYATMTTVLLTGILSFLLFKKILGDFFSLVLSILILFSGTLVNISTFAFHANVLPLLTILMIYFCYLAAIKKTIYIAFAFLSTSLMFHADPAPAVVSTFIPLATLVIFKLYKSKDFPKTIQYLVIAFAVPFIPQILFEIRNDFIQTKSLSAYFLGQNPSLSGQLPFLERVENRIDVFFNFFKNSMTGQNQLFAFLFLVGVCFGIYFFIFARRTPSSLTRRITTQKRIHTSEDWEYLLAHVNLKRTIPRPFRPRKFIKKVRDLDLRKLFYLSLLALSVFFLLFTVVFTVEVKVWYLYGLPPIFAILVTLILQTFSRYKNLIFLFLAIFILFNILPFMSETKKSIIKKDPATLTNQLSAIDFIYNDAASPFSVYVFTPSVYDHNYQYLFWWQGVKLKRGLPQDFAYLPNQPDYVRNKNFYTPIAQKSNTIYLIIENALENQFYTRQNWLANFADYPVIWQKDINNALTVQKRQQ